MLARTTRRRVGMALLALLLLATLPPQQATAHDSRGRTTRTTIHIPLIVLDNLCANAEPVALSGDLYVVVTTRAERNGYRVVSRSYAPDLRGQGLVSGVSYRGSDGENSVAYYAPPPYPSRWSVTHWTVLIPNGQVPRMYLVIVLRQVIGADGSVVPTLEGTRLTCRRPQSDAKEEDDDDSDDDAVGRAVQRAGARAGGS